jgi:hypothetical protein
MHRDPIFLNGIDLFCAISFANCILMTGTKNNYGKS